MKINRGILSLSISLLIIILQTTMVIAVDSTPIDIPASAQQPLGGLTGAPEIDSASEIPINNGNNEPTEHNKTSSEPNANRVLPDIPRQQSTSSTENSFNLNRANTGTNTNANTGNENIILNSMPEIPETKELDTLGKIINWWLANPFEMKLWYLFLALSMIFFLFKQTSFRKPLLLASLVIFGFYLGNTVNPINSIFSIPVQTGVQLADTIILVALPIILSLIVGRIFCGWACPIGAIQEFIHPENFNLRLPSLVNQVLNYFRFIILIGGIFVSWASISNIWDYYDPFRVFFTFKGSLTTIILLFIILTGSIFIERFFCHYLCPLGAILAVTSRFSFFKMRPDSDTCIACGKCSRPGACSMNIISAVNPYTDLPIIEASECILCHCCADNCRYSAFKVSFSNKKRGKSNKTKNPSQRLSV